jgi:hypothetical protein
MLTTSETAPMVQKFVRLATAPKMNARTKPPKVTMRPRFEVLPDKTGISPFVRALFYLR